MSFLKGLGLNQIIIPKKSTSTEKEDIKVNNNLNTLISNIPMLSAYAGLGLVSFMGGFNMPKSKLISKTMPEGFIGPPPLIEVEAELKDKIISAFLNMGAGLSGLYMVTESSTIVGEGVGATILAYILISPALNDFISTHPGVGQFLDLIDGFGKISESFAKISEIFPTGR